MIDLSLLRITKYRKDFWKVMGRVPEAALERQTNAILKDFRHYFEQLPEHEVVDQATFMPMFRARHPTLSDESRNAFEGILNNVFKEDVGEAEHDSIMRSMLELRLGTQTASLLAQYDAGDLPNIQVALSNLLDEFKADANIQDSGFVDDDIDDLLRDEMDDSGLRWRLDCLNQHVRGLRPGDFGIVAGRPDKGKTTFIASELTYLAAQLPDDQCAIWFNNEGQGKRIIPRMYQAALGAKTSDLIALSNAGKLKPAYAKKMGFMKRVQIKDIHNMDCFTVEGIVEKYKPGLVVFDMIDKIRGFGDAARTDLGLEMMYDWARNLCVKHNMAGIATSQISNDGDGLQFPTMGMLKDSKTGKQGACDFQLMIGASNDPGLANQRFIGMPKNKLRREGMPQDPRATVKYDPQRARYEDIPVAPEDKEQKDEQD